MVLEHNFVLGKLGRAKAYRGINGNLLQMHNMYLLIGNIKRLRLSLEHISSPFILGYYIHDIGKGCCLGKDGLDRLQCFHDEKKCLSVKESSSTLVTEHGCFTWELNQPVKLTECSDANKKDQEVRNV